jgi:hypothetical protein
MASFLKREFNLDATQVKQNILRLPSGIVLHTKYSASRSNWYGLDKKIYDEFMSLASDVFLTLSLKGPENTFVIPKEKILDMFEEKDLEKRPG